MRQEALRHATVLRLVTYIAGPGEPRPDGALRARPTSTCAPPPSETWTPRRCRSCRRSACHRLRRWPKRQRCSPCGGISTCRPPYRPDRCTLAPRRGLG